MSMKNPEKFYETTMKNKPSALIRKFFLLKYNKKLKGNTAIDLGCGTGNDTEFLLSKGYKVTAIDCEETVKDIFKSKNIKSDNLNIIIDDFSKIKLPKADLILSNFSIFFIKDKFKEFIENLLRENVNPNGFFIGNFLGKEDDWNKRITTVDKEELLNYFRNYNILYFSEEKYYQDSSSSKNKYWHIYTIIAQKNKNLIHNELEKI